MSRLVMMGVAVLVCECCDSVCPRGQPPSPLGISLLRAIRTTSVLTCGTACPCPPLPSPSSLGDMRTHILPLMRVLLFDVQSGSLAGNLYLGERGRLVPWGGAKEGQGMPGGKRGQGSPEPLLSPGTAAAPPSQDPTPIPQRGGPCLQ